MNKPNAAELWIAQWPHYCRTCEGYGVITWYEHHDQGYPGEPMADTCDACLGQDKCPRCGAKTFELQQDGNHPDVCITCGWKVNEPDGLPPVEEDDPNDFNLGEN